MPNAEQPADTSSHDNSPRYPEVPCATKVSGNTGNGHDSRREHSQEGIVIMSHNIGGLYNKMAAALGTEADVYAWQEADLGITLRSAAVSKAKELGYALTTSFTCGEGESTDERRQGRAAIATKHGIRAYALALQDADTLMLAESGRWHERMIPTRNGESFIIVATLYGYSGASWDPAL